MPNAKRPKANTVLGDMAREILEMEEAERSELACAYINAPRFRIPGSKVAVFVRYLSMDPKPDVALCHETGHITLAGGGFTTKPGWQEW